MSSEINYCSQCGNKVTHTDKNCKKCGYDIQKRRDSLKQDEALINMHKMFQQEKGNMNPGNIHKVLQRPEWNAFKSAASVLDELANSLESKGLIKEAEELDIVSNTLEDAKMPEPEPLVKGDIQKRKTDEQVDDEVALMKGVSNRVFNIGIDPSVWAHLDKSKKEELIKILDERTGEFYNSVHIKQYLDPVWEAEVRGGTIEMFFEENKKSTPEYIKKYDDNEAAIKKMLSDLPEVYDFVKSKHDKLLKEYMSNPDKLAAAKKRHWGKALNNEKDPIYERYLLALRNKIDREHHRDSPYSAKALGIKEPKPTHEIPKLASILDKVANSLESKGLIKEAEELDIISNTLEAMAPAPVAPAQGQVAPPTGGAQPLDLNNFKPGDIKKKKVNVVIKSSSISENRAVLAFVVEAGLKKDFLDLFHKGKNAWVSTWNSLKDEATKAMIKGLDTADKVKKFVIAHPELKYVVLAAIALGVLALPGIASADILQPEKVTQLADKLQWVTTGAGTSVQSISVHVPPGWTDEVILNSLKGHGVADAPKVLSDVYQNLSNILIEKGKITGMLKDHPDTFKELAQTTLEGLQSSINTILSKFI